MKVLFVCVGNAARSQMAEAFFNHLTKSSSAESAGTEPAEKISLKAVEVMKEAGIDISSAKPKLLTQKMVDGADRIITMGCLHESSCPLFLIKEKSKIEDWNIADPRGKRTEDVRMARDEIKKRVEALIRELSIQSDNHGKKSV